MQNVSYDFSSVHIDLPVVIAEEVVWWGKEYITDDDIFVSQRDPTYGREDEIHITVLYGLHADKSDQVRELMSKQKPIFVKLGKVNVLPNLKFDVVVIDAQSEDLEGANKQLARHVSHNNQYKSYRPHVTIGYVKKGKGWKHVGCARWEGRKFIADYIVFSSKNGTKEKIPLGQ
jgi:hypothetical protein